MWGVAYVVGDPTHTDRQPLRHIEAIMDAVYTEDLTRAFPISPQATTGWSSMPRRHGPRIAAFDEAVTASLTWTGEPRDTRRLTHYDRR
ncbi:hypothetical protein C3492_10560 [Streptomyces sp. Ru62]|nr:hypothetical protein C3492_10560 [Streptomyces sp. Ru62]